MHGHKLIVLGKVTCYKLDGLDSISGRRVSALLCPIQRFRLAVRVVWSHNMGEYDEDPTQEQDDLLVDGHVEIGGGPTPGDLFIKTVTGIKRVLPSIFNLKVVSEGGRPHFTIITLFIYVYHNVYSVLESKHRSTNSVFR